MEVKIDKPMLNVGDVIEWTPDKGSLKGMTLTCVVVEVLRVFDPTTFEPVFRVIIEFEINGHREQLALPLDADYNVVSKS